MKTIEAGSRAPDFELPDEAGRPVHLAERLADGPVVLFFYPTALSGGCTAEVCHFRDLAAEFAAAGAQPIGISTDTMATAAASSPRRPASPSRSSPTSTATSPAPTA